MISRLIFSPLSNQRGFSFLSVTVLLVFLSLSSSLVLTMLSPITASGSVEDTLKKMDKIKNAIAVYKSQHAGLPPNTLDELVVAQTPSCAPDTNSANSTYRTLQGWCGPYLDKSFTNSSEFKQDAWGSILQYDKINLKSCGPSQVCGDGDDISLPI